MQKHFLFILLGLLSLSDNLFWPAAMSSLLSLSLLALFHFLISFFSIKVNHSFSEDKFNHSVIYYKNLNNSHLYANIRNLSSLRIVYIMLNFIR
ncbi:MAG TPA: hypothetical protein DCL86_08555 [Bacteroidales bacterium]|nr:hypothetical protein [Bacteroidales bacterium]